MSRRTWKRSVVASAGARWFRAPRKLRASRVIDEFSLLLFSPSVHISSRYSYLIISSDACLLFFFLSLFVKSASNVCNDQRSTSSSIIYEKNLNVPSTSSSLSRTLDFYPFFSFLHFKHKIQSILFGWRVDRFRLAYVRGSIRSNMIWFTIKRR